jgi:aspartate/methionine/tyrosine aminotransferase
LTEHSWVFRLLSEQNVIVQPGYFFDMASEPYIVVSLITPEPDFEEGLRRVAEFAAAEC